MTHENNVDRWPTGSPLLVQVKYYIDSKLAGGGGGNPELEQRVTDLEATTATQAGEIAAAQSDITALEATTTTQASQIDALQQENTDQAGQISDLETRVAALEAQPAPVQQEAIYVWDGTSYNVPATPPEGVILRSLYGPTPYTGDPWPGVLDAYTFAETVA